LDKIYYKQKNKQNKIRCSKGLSVDTRAIFLHEMVEYYYQLQKQAFDRLVEENLAD
jgi:hypothetical protein